MIKGKLALALGIIEGIIIIALIVFIVMLLNGNKNIDSIKTADINTTNNVINKNAADTNNDAANSAQLKKVLNMSDAEFLEYAENFTDFEYEGFDIEEKEKEYENGYGSASNVSEAIELVKKRVYTQGYPNIKKIMYEEETIDDVIDAKLVTENDYYYVINVHYTAKRTTGDLVAEDTVVVFKNDMFESVWEYNNHLRKINLTSANTKEKIKKIMDLYMFLTNKTNIFGTTLVEKDDYYEYTYYYVLYGSNGDEPIVTDTAVMIKQEAVLGTYTIKIDKKDGRFDDDAGEIKKLRTVEGKTIEMELPNQSED